MELCMIAYRLQHYISKLHIQENEVSDGEPGSEPPSDEAESIGYSDEEEELQQRPSKRKKKNDFIIEEAGIIIGNTV